MAILTEADRAIYFPDVALTGATLVGAILRSQHIAEGPSGANRPLELQEFQEVVRVNTSMQSCYLSRLPIAEQPAPVIQARLGGYRDGFGRSVPRSAFLPLFVADYQLDDVTGQLQINCSDESSMGFGSRQPITEIKATYTSGFDFTKNTYLERAIKSAIAAILSYQQSSNYQGIAETEIAGEYRVRYASSGMPATIPESLLLPFRKYRSRSFC